LPYHLATAPSWMGYSQNSAPRSLKSISNDLLRHRHRRAQPEAETHLRWQRGGWACQQNLSRTHATPSASADCRPFSPARDRADDRSNRRAAADLRGILPAASLYASLKTVRLDRVYANGWMGGISRRGRRLAETPTGPWSGPNRPARSSARSGRAHRYSRCGGHIGFPDSGGPLRANIDETVLLVVITEQGEKRNQT